MIKVKPYSFHTVAIISHSLVASEKAARIRQVPHLSCQTRICF